MNNKGYYFGASVKNENPVTTQKAEHYDNEPNYIEVINNRIYFYSEIDADKVLRLNKEILMLNNQLLIDAKVQNRESANIYLHIFSYGGFLDSGFAGSDAIVNSIVPIITVIDGVCASAGTLLSLVGKERWINKHGRMLIHQLSGCSWGTYEQMADDKKNQDLLMQKLKDFYLQYTKVPEKKLMEMLKHDIYFDSEDCLKMGLADKIV